MAIIVKHETGAGVQLATALGAGQAEQKAKGLLGEARAIEQRAGREDTQEFTKEMDKLNFEQQQSIFDQQQQAEREGFEFKLSAKQESDKRGLQNSLHELEMSDSFTPEEKAEGRRKIEAKMLGIKPFAEKIEKVDFLKNIFTDPETGKRIHIDPNTNKITTIGDINEAKGGMSKADDQKLWQWALKETFNKKTQVHDEAKALKLYNLAKRQNQEQGGAGTQAQPLIGGQAPAGPVVDEPLTHFNAVDNRFIGPGGTETRPGSVVQLGLDQPPLDFPLPSAADAQALPPKPAPISTDINNVQLSDIPKWLEGNRYSSEAINQVLGKIRLPQSFKSKILSVHTKFESEPDAIKAAVHLEKLEELIASAIKSEKPTKIETSNIIEAEIAKEEAQIKKIKEKNRKTSKKRFKALKRKDIITGL